MKNRFSLVIFDLDGTLADTHQLIFDSFNFVMRKYKSVELTPQGIMSYFGPPEEVCIKNMMGADDFVNAWHDYLEYYKKHLDKSLIFPGVSQLLSNLKSSGSRLGIFTGKGKETAELTLEFHGIRHIFDIVVTGSGVKNHKPNPEGVNLALNKLKVKAKDAVLVGDSLSDYRAATSAGTHFIAAMYDTLPKSHFDSLECKRVKSVKELSNVLLPDSGQ